MEEGQVWVELMHECEEVPKDLWQKLQNAISVSSQKETVEGSRILETIE